MANELTQNTSKGSFHVANGLPNGGGVRVSKIPDGPPMAVEVAPPRPPFFFPSGAGAPPSNRVSWEETAAAHIYSANLPGLRKEEIRVEVEDARYLVIRTELNDDGAEDAVEDGRRRSFARKFRLRGMMDAAGGISAEHTHGVLTVTVPRMHTPAPARRRLRGPGSLN